MTTYLPYPALAPKHSSAQLLYGTGFTLLHIPLAIAMHRSSAFATVHAIFALLACVAIGLLNTRTLHILGAISYIAGAEVLWRMSKAYVPWEFGKYSICLLLAVALVRLKNIWLPRQILVYFLLLLPSCVPAMLGFGWSNGLKHISFYLSGPLTVVLMLSLLRNVSVTRADIAAALDMVIPPTIGIAAIAASGTYAKDVQFSGASNTSTSGGFGPDQVAAALALGAFAAAWILFTVQITGIRRLAVIAAGLGLFVQSAMTFSRSGVFINAIALLIVCLTHLPDRRYRGKILGSVLALLLGAAILFPALNSYTDGRLLARFQRKDITNRDVLMMQDLALWLANPVFGGGVGVSALVHLDGKASHTEYSRLVAEHGLLGLVSLLILVFTAYGRWRRCTETLEKAFVASMMMWFFLYIGVNGMRLVAPIFTFGLGYAQWQMIRSRQPASSRA